jgi:REP element-mobilizing transposase RayT
MKDIMIIAYHIIFTTYGTWLPNDPRGSFSEQIYNQKLAVIAPIKYGKQKNIPDKKDLNKFWSDSSKRLDCKPYFIDEKSRQIIADSFADTINGLKLKVPACAIMKDHIHIIILRTEYKTGYIVNQLKSTVTKNLNLKKTPWTEGYWKVFIDKPEILQSAIRYVNSNPVSGGMARQNWKFVSSISTLRPPRAAALKPRPKWRGLNGAINPASSGRG